MTDTRPDPLTTKRNIFITSFYLPELSVAICSFPRSLSGHSKSLSHNSRLKKKNIAFIPFHSYFSKYENDKYQTEQGMFQMTEAGVSITDQL